MGDPTLHHPNDKLLKATFSNPENARAFFQNHLVPEIVPAIDWATLSLEQASFVDPDFAASESDLLFRVKIEESESFLYLLFEHQSTEDPRIAQRLLSYIVRIWERFAREHPLPAKLPPVIPLVLAQSKRPWKTSVNLGDLIDYPPAWKERIEPWQPALSYQLFELVRTPYEQLKGTPEGVLTLRALKAEPVGELMGEPVWDGAIMRAISVAALEQFLRYVLNAVEDMERVLEKAREIKVKPLHQNAMTIAERLRTEGLEEGLQKGRQEGRQEGRAEGEVAGMQSSILQALEVRFGPVSGRVTGAVRSIGEAKRLSDLLGESIRCVSLEAFQKLL